ncbi:hypothetical protein CLV46_0056 [Diaminobutyricimonas aerilata]|uniref:Biopolymer transporter Tol n=1 Tax=Diaminobutyricimonas aerilata TaxID=1162967 RepID=A0A2M9CF33_9MICO|nr:hypothetical protein CLV46_0056 [Diaminobutyricimonas aerilata]
MEPESSDEERWLVIGGRRWRRTDPALPDDVVARLRSHLGRGRAGVRTATRSGDEAAVAAARHRVNLAKHALGERGPKWWESDERARLERAHAGLAQLDALDAPDAGARVSEGGTPDAGAPASGDAHAPGPDGPAVP